MTAFMHLEKSAIETTKLARSQIIQKQIMAQKQVVNSSDSTSGG